MEQVKVSNIIRDELLIQAANLQSRNKILSFCDLCGKSFNSLMILRDHMINEFAIEREMITILNTELGLDPNTPSPKGEYYGEQDLKKPYSCATCHKIFESRQGLNQHVGKKHTANAKNSICSVCGKLFTHKYALKFHYEQVHETAKRVNCKLCGYMAYNKYKLKKHIQKRHANI
ncbi:unnamed protein product [Blepharisma stoltei]|uniref:C2H2-type domain-containing protein n=1 Tax=Blepharisma stoltei TaxID=1481888 RepID=A0AAU9KQJ1_9CILI|nr:unnamed protein product [Blepharisma stoltei]